MASPSSTTMSGLFSKNFIPSPITAPEKWLGFSNYVLWSKVDDMWCKGQGLNDHLYTKLEIMKIDKNKNCGKADA